MFVYACPTASGISTRELDVEVLAEGFGHVQVGLTVPLHVVHEVGLRYRIEDRRAEHQPVAEGSREMMTLDCFEVDG